MLLTLNLILFVLAPPSYDEAIKSGDNDLSRQRELQYQLAPLYDKEETSRKNSIERTQI